MFAKLYDTEMGQILVHKDIIGEEGLPCIYLTCEVEDGFLNTCLISDSLDDLLNIFDSFTQKSIRFL